MPLSEHEQRVLEEIERSLLDDDPKFASAVRSADPRQHALRRALWSGALFLLGVSVLVLGLVTQIAPAGVPIVALAGFALMFFAAIFFMRTYKNGGEKTRAPRKALPASSRASVKQTRGSLIDRLEERWRRRQRGM